MITELQAKEKLETILPKLAIVFHMALDKQRVLNEWYASYGKQLVRTQRCNFYNCVYNEIMIGDFHDCRIKEEHESLVMEHNGLFFRFKKFTSDGVNYNTNNQLTKRIKKIIGQSYQMRFDYFGEGEQVPPVSSEILDIGYELDEAQENFLYLKVALNHNKHTLWYFDLPHVAVSDIPVVGMPALDKPSKRFTIPSQEDETKQTGTGND